MSIRIGRLWIGWAPCVLACGTLAGLLGCGSSQNSSCTSDGKGSADPFSTPCPGGTGAAGESGGKSGGSGGSTGTAGGVVADASAGGSSGSGGTATGFGGTGTAGSG